MKIIFFDTESIAVDPALVGELHEHDVVFVPEALTPENAHLYTDADIISVFVSSRVTAEVIASMPNLVLIAARSTGLDHIAVESAKERGISVTNVAGYGEHTVAEFTFALLFALTRKVAYAHDALTTGRAFTLNEFAGTDLFGRTMAVIGTGRIGRRVIEIARAFGMNVLAYDVMQNQEHATAFSYAYADIDTALSTADIVSLHTPYTQETHHILNEQRIKNLKKGVLLVNTARGELVDTLALIEALETGAIAGAALDVFEGPVPPPALAQNPRAVVTPHVAFCSADAIETITKSAVNSIRDFLQK